MKVILKTRVPKLGHEWDIVNVKDGFAQNYLFPNLLAEPATATLIKRSDAKRADRFKAAEEVVQHAKEIAEKLSSVTLSFTKKTRGEKLYGSLTEKEIAEALAADHKITVEKEWIRIGTPIKTAGDHTVKLHITEGVDVKLQIKIAKED